MTEPRQARNPFVLGTPIKSPEDFYGRERILRELFDAVLEGQLVALVGEHRCGNTSVIYQMLHDAVRPRFLSGAEDEARLFVLLSAQLAADSPRAFLRRIGRALRRADSEAGVAFDGEIDQLWLEDYLEDLADRGRRLVLLIDEFEVLAGLESAMWEWFEGLVNDYTVSIVATTRQDLGRFRTEQGIGPPFFNLFRSVYIGSFEPQTVDFFLTEKSEITDFDFFSVREVIDDLAGLFPYYIQVASALFYLHAGGEGKVTEPEIETVRQDFKARTAKLFEDAWPKLPQTEREALIWLVLGKRPEGDDAQLFDQAIQALVKRGYVVDGRAFSSAFADYVIEELRRIGVNTDTGRARVEDRLVKLPPKETVLLAFLIEHDGEVVTRETIAEAVWPELTVEGRRVSDTVIDETLDVIRQAVEDDEGFNHIEQLSENAFLFMNTDYPPVDAIAD